MRTIWIAEEKRRAERQAREASYVPASQEEEELDEDRVEELSPSTAQRKGMKANNSGFQALTLSIDEEMADEVAQQEEAEIEALLSMMDTKSTSSRPEPYVRPETPYGSDDEEYDHIFLDVINEESMSDNKQQQAEDLTKIDEDFMDMS